MKYTYTPEGWLQSLTKADGTLLTFDYDKTGSLLTQHVGDGHSIESSYNELGMVTTVSSEAGKITYRYNAQGYLISVRNVNGDMVSYTYDQYGNKTSMTYPDGKQVWYTYDAMNRMVSATGLDGELTSYTYDAAGRRIQTQTGNPTGTNSLTSTYHYDSVGNLLEQASSGIGNITFRYSYNKNGYITGEKRIENGKTTENAYTYDPLGQLTAFTKSTGYSEQYAYDAAGNMLQKVITGENSDTNTNSSPISLKMQYNKGNQLISMANGQDRIAYSYDKNGSMVKKVLTSKVHGKLSDTYAYNALDQLTSYMGYDGFQQQLTYDANGMRLSKREAGNTNRSTLEELLRGNIAGLPKIVKPNKSQTNDDDALPEELEWASTEYLYDLTQEYYQVIEEKTTNKNVTSRTAYAYGIERIAAYTETQKTTYVYDGRGSVVQTLTIPVAGQSTMAALPDTQVKVQSFSYTAFGEQMNRKVSGFGYNAEAFDAACGMINLRARQYEPGMNRFSQKDIVRRSLGNGLSENRYLYTQNKPIPFADSDGMFLHSILDGIKKLGKKVMQAFIPQAKAESANDYTAQIKNSISNLTSAALDGYLKSAKNNDPYVKKAYENANKKIAKSRKNSPSVNEDTIFKQECAIISLQLIRAAGKTTEQLTYQETRDIFEYAKYSNFRTTTKERKQISDNRGETLKRRIIVATNNNTPKCAGYVYNAIVGRNFSKMENKSSLGQSLLKGWNRNKKIGNSTTPQYAWLIGEITRDSQIKENDGQMAPSVLSMISLSNKEEITYKLFGDKDYTSISYTSDFSYQEQWEILVESQVLRPTDLVFVGGLDENGVIRDRYIDMHHVVIMDSYETYMGQNSARINASIEQNYIVPNLILQEKKKKNAPHRLYFVLLNSNDEAVEEITKLYPVELD